MSKIWVELPDELYDELRARAAKANTSVEALAVRAVETLVDNFRWLDRLDERAMRSHEANGHTHAEAMDLELPGVDTKVPLDGPLNARLQERVGKENTTVEEFVVRILMETLDQMQRFDERCSSGGGPEALRRILAKVPNVEPPEYDRLP